MFQQAKGSLEPLLDHCVVDGCKLKQTFGISLFQSDGSLSGLEVFRSDGLNQVRINQLLALGLQPLQAPALGL